MDNLNSDNSSKIGLFGCLGIVFIILKLTNVINWSWWWVTFPLWGGLALALIMLLVFIVLMAKK